MSLDEKFKAACDEIKRFKKRPSDHEMLEIYALYKQATIGDVNIAKPADAKGKAKWDAWNGKNGIKSTVAKEQYVAKVKSLAGTYA